MTFSYVENTVKFIYKIYYIDRHDITDSTEIEAYSEKQAIYLFKKKYKDGERITDIFEIGKLPDKNGNQMVMDLGDI